MIISMESRLKQEAERRWEEFARAARDKKVSLGSVAVSPGEAGMVFSQSDFITRSCLSAPGMLVELIDSGDLLGPDPDPETYFREKVEERLKSVSGDEALSLALRGLRKREMVRIAWRDLAGISGIREIMKETSILAETVVDAAVQAIYEDLAGVWGCPVDNHGNRLALVVLGMGKLGARELNFSSDIDLVFAFRQSGMTAGGPQSVGNEQFFTKLCHRFLKVFSETDPAGLLFRVDIRLRPYGESGPVVMSFDAMEDYYLRQGREWERYAAVKASMISGSAEDERILFQKLHAFVFRRYLDYAVFDALRDMKGKIMDQVRSRGYLRNVKLGEGGIREVEFFGQVFQLIRGGVDVRMRQPEILAVLPLMAEESWIPGSVKEELESAYLFLRRVENRLQIRDDRQVHDLPEGEPDWLAFSMKHGSWGSFHDELTRHMAAVRNHFSELLGGEAHEEEGPFARLVSVWQDTLPRSEAIKVLAEAGFVEPEEGLRLLCVLRDSGNTRALSRSGRSRLDRFMPLLLERVGGCRKPSVALGRLLDLIGAIQRRTCYIALLMENPEALDNLVLLAAESSWIVKFLAKHPVLLDDLIDHRTLLSPPEKADMRREVLRRLGRVDRSDEEFALEEMCVFKQSMVLRIAAADIQGNTPIMRVSDHLTHLAETVLEMVLEIAWGRLVIKYGTPGGISGKGFTIIGFGKLGGIELGYGSDLDLVFLYDGRSGMTAGGSLSIENSQFYARLGQRIIHILSMKTAAGGLYDADMRLRPSGSSGLIVSPVDAYEEYCLKSAWTWEHQALVRARSITGDPQLMASFERVRMSVLGMSREQGTLRDEVSGMREKIRAGKANCREGAFDLKQDLGGMVDIEFLVQYLVLLSAPGHMAVGRWSDNVRLLESLCEAGVLSKDEAGDLKEAYLSYREQVHRRDLLELSSLVSEEEFAGPRDRVIKIWGKYLG